jgi:hypothetical protein
VCKEVLEHIPAECHQQVLANIGTSSDLLIVTTPKPNMRDRDDRTHVSVLPRSSWIEISQANAFVEDTRPSAAVFGIGYKADPDMSVFVLRRSA